MTDGTGMTPPAPASMGGPGSNARLIALLGWLFTPLGIIALFLDDYKQDRYVRSHVIQAAAFEVGVWVLYAVLSVIPFIGWVLMPILGLGDIVVRILYGIRAYNGTTVEFPVVYGLVKNMIENVG